MPAPLTVLLLVHPHFLQGNNLICLGVPGSVWNGESPVMDGNPLPTCRSVCHSGPLPEILKSGGSLSCLTTRCPVILVPHSLQDNTLAHETSAPGELSSELGRGGLLVTAPYKFPSYSTVCPPLLCVLTGTFYKALYLEKQTLILCKDGSPMHCADFCSSQILGSRGRPTPPLLQLQLWLLLGHGTCQPPDAQLPGQVFTRTSFCPGGSRASGRLPALTELLRDIPRYQASLFGHSHTMP